MVRTTFARRWTFSRVSVARFEGNVAAVGVLEVLGAQRRLASPDGPTCGIVTSVCHSVSCANPRLVQRATRLAAEQFGNAIRGSQIGDMGSGSLPAPSGADMPHSVVLDENNGVVFGSIGQGWHKQYLAMLAWRVLLAITLVLASLLHAVAATALVVPETALAAAHFDDVPDTLRVETLYAAPESCSVPATDGKACIS
jgi:hypothetical protein